MSIPANHYRNLFAQVNWFRV